MNLVERTEKHIAESRACHEFRACDPAGRQAVVDLLQRTLLEKMTQNETTDPMVLEKPMAEGELKALKQAVTLLELVGEVDARKGW